ncbi:MAG: glycoside hydrolase family 5 [Marmoricola sp.]|nr:glycoside hydrolase family 5 [Marmoricola sp.]
MRRVPVLLGVATAMVAAVAVLLSTVGHGRDAADRAQADGDAFPIGISFGDQLRRIPDDEVTSALDDVVELHANWIRIDLSWAEIQPDSAATYDWEAIDHIVAEAAARDLKVLGILTYTPPWARAPGCVDFTCPPRLASEFGTFARAAAERYGTNRISALEIWNEPNTPKFWANPDAIAYRAVLAATIRSIREVDSSVTLLFGGLAANPTGDGVIVAPDFLAEACRAGVCSGLDGVGYHPYTFPLTAHDELPERTAWERMTARSTWGPGLREVLTAGQPRRDKIWVTEYGAPTAGGITEQQQARIVSSGVTAARAAPSRIGAVFIYTWKDLGTSEDVEDHFGLLRQDGSHKPAFDAFARAAGER